MNVEKEFYLPYAITTPRGPRTDYKQECSCSNSCEKVIEILIEDNEKLSFEEKELIFDLPLPTYSVSEESKLMYDKVRNLSFSILEDRAFSIPIRLISLGRILQNVQKAKSNHLPIDFDSLKAETLINEIRINTDLLLSFKVQESLVSFFAEYSTNIKLYYEIANSYYKEGNEIEQYIKGKNRLKLLLPNIEVMIEKILINYLFFEQFPYSYNRQPILEQFKSLCGVYLFINYLVIGYMAKKDTQSDLIDVISAAFRLINHSKFDRNVDILLQQNNILSLEQVESILID